MEPVLRKLQYEFENKLHLRYCMGGLIPSWKNFHDPINAVTRPVQMGPVWMHAAQLSGMTIDHNYWMKDPLASSYPACIGFKCVELQSVKYAGLYLRLLREACMLNGINIAKQAELITLANKLQVYYPGFDVQRFSRDLTNGTGLEAFRLDIQEVKNNNIERFPALVLRRRGNASILISGYRPYNVLLEAIKQIYPEIKKVKEIVSADVYRSYWPTITEREVEEGMVK